MSTYIWACYDEEPPWPPSAQAPNAQRVYMQDVNERWLWVDYVGDVPTPQEVYDSMHLRAAPGAE